MVPAMTIEHSSFCIAALRIVVSKAKKRDKLARG